MALQRNNRKFLHFRNKLTHFMAFTGYNPRYFKTEETCSGLQRKYPV
jgi:hypothetical protein